MAAARERSSGRRRVLPTVWPFYVLFVGLPVWWVLGLAGLVWPIVAFVMLFALLRRRRVDLPRGFLLWGGFVFWVLATATQIDSFGRAAGFAYRAAIYVGATIVLLYVFNASRQALPTHRVVAILGIFWTFVIIGGYLGLVFPDFSFTSPVESLLPGALLSNDFVKELVHPAFAQVQDFLGYVTPRPSAPFVYTNDWGANFALLVPFVMMVWSLPFSRRFKMILGAFAAASVVPVTLSLNRGLWLSLGLGLVYAAVLMAIRGRERPLVGIVVAISFVGFMALFTPLKAVITERLEEPHSNARRVSLYEEAVRGAVESPLFGYGAPRPSTWNPDAPSVGTQGAIWLVLFSHGFIGVALFAGWFIFCFWRLRHSRDPVGFWCHVMLAIFIVQWPVYGMIPVQIIIVMIGIGLAFRERRQPTALRTAQRQVPEPVGVGA